MNAQQFLVNVPIERSWDEIRTAARLLGLEPVSIRRFKPVAQAQMDLNNPYTHWQVVLEPSADVQRVGGY